MDAPPPTDGPVELEAHWEALPWLLGGLGAFAGLIVWLLLDVEGPDVPWRMGLAAFVAFGTLAIGFTLEPRRPTGPLLFSLAVAVVLGGLAFHITRSGDRLTGPEYSFAAGLLASVLALPLFQAGFLGERFAVPYRRVHFHVWTDAVAGAGAAGFALLSFALLWLVDGLLSLVGIFVIEDMIQDGWLAPVWLAGSFGAALGVLRGQLKVIGAMQAVALLVLALLAVPLALALLVFLGALILSGGTALWEATDSATPVLLVCAAGSWVLVNAVIRDDDMAASRNRVMQAAALVLALGILPLGLFAAISMGLRIDQHGLAPERLWALVAIGVAVAFGLAYLVAVGRGRGAGWAERMRAANLRLAAGVGVLALLLALPILDFGAISASSQIARLRAGEVSPDEFDYSALRWDFGEAGRRALARLAEGDGRAAELAALALAQEEPVFEPEPPPDHAVRLQRFRVEGATPELERQLRGFLASNSWRCEATGCTALALGQVEGGTHVVLVSGVQVAHLVVSPEGAVGELMLTGGTLRPLDRPITVPPSPAPGASVEVRPYAGRQVFVDGQPVDAPFP